MTKADLVDRVCDQIGPHVTKRDCHQIVDAFLDSVKQVLAAGEHIEIRGFGTFSTRERKPHLGRNPRTGAPVQVAAQRVTTLKFAKDFKAVTADSHQARQQL